MALFATVWLAVGVAPAGAAAPCGQPITDRVVITVADSAGAPASTFEAGSLVRLNFAVPNLQPGHCAGDTLTVGLPAGLRALNGASWLMKAPDGATYGTMRVVDRTIVITLSPYVETHPLNGSMKGYVEMRLEGTGSKSLDFTVNGEVTRIPITVKPAASCVDCYGMPTELNKWGNYDDGGVTLNGPVVAKAGTTVTFTDKLTSPAQRIDCTKAPSGFTFLSKNGAGSPVDPVDITNLRVTGCTADTVTGTFITTADRQAFQLFIPVIFDTVEGTVASWNDHATVNFDSAVYERDHAVKVIDGGGSGVGNSVPVTSTTAPPSSTTSTTNTTSTTDPKGSLPLSGNSGGSGGVTTGSAASSAASPIFMQASPNYTGSLPSTGSEAVRLAVLGLGLVGAGGLALGTVHRRRRR